MLEPFAMLAWSDVPSRWWIGLIVVIVLAIASGGDDDLTH